MASDWKTTRAAMVEAGDLDESRIAEHRSVLELRLAAARLAELRRARNLSQRQVAQAMGVSQPRVSAIEAGAPTAAEVATLRAYVAALGGELHLVADFGGDSVTVV